MIRKIKTAWKNLARRFDDDDTSMRFSKRIVNIGHLLAGNFGAAGISFLAVALAARGLGVEKFGVLALVSTFIQAVERFVGFQTWQPIIRYGAGLREQGRMDDLKSVIKFGFLLDVTAVVAGFCLSVGLALAGAQQFGWSPEVVKSLLLYSTALLFLINGSPTGVMRLSGRFGEIAYFQVVSMSMRCALCAVALYFNAGLFTYVAIWAATHVLGAQLLLLTGIRELRRIDSLNFLSASLENLSGRFPKIWRFSILANLSLSIRSSAQQLDTLLVGALAGPSGAGLYHIAKRIAKFAQQAGQHIQAVVFPDIAKLWALGDRSAFRKDVARTEALLTIICVIGIGATFVLAEPVVSILAGGKFAGAGVMLKVQIIAVAALLAGSVTRAALLCMGRETTVFIIAVFSTVIFFGLAFWLIPAYGAIGGNIAHAGAGVFVVTCLWLAYQLALRDTVYHRTEDKRNLTLDGDDSA